MASLKKIRMWAGMLSFFSISILFIDIWYLLPTPFFRFALLFQFIPSLFGTLNGVMLSVFAFVFLLFITMMWGRIYCSFFCPLGILMDGIIRLKNRMGYKKRKGFYIMSPLPRYIILFLLIVSVLAGISVVLNITDPYSNFGKIMAHLVRPVVIFCQQAVARIFAYMQLSTIPSIPYKGFQLPVFIFTLFYFVLIVFLTVTADRKYCNLICPVGAFLGLMSKLSIYRLKIDSTTCISCGKCEKSCKSGCVHLPTLTIDRERCVACFNCIESCPQESIAYRVSIPGSTKIKEKVC